MKFTVLLSEQEQRALAELAARDGVSAADVFRRFLHTSMQKEETKR